MFYRKTYFIAHNSKIIFSSFNGAIRFFEVVEKIFFFLVLMCIPDVEETNQNNFLGVLCLLSRTKGI